MGQKNQTKRQFDTLARWADTLEIKITPPLHTAALFPFPILFVSWKSKKRCAVPLFPPMSPNAVAGTQR